MLPEDVLLMKLTFTLVSNYKAVNNMNLAPARYSYMYTCIGKIVK